MMCPYTTVNGTAMCESAEWQEQWARKKLGFAGNIVTDCTALNMKASLTALSHTHTHIPFLPRICSRTLVDRFAPLRTGRTKQPVRDLSV